MTQVSAGGRSSGLASLLFAGVAAGAMSQVALAADTPGASGGAGTQVGEVVVTANRSGAQSLQKVAIPISVVNVDQVDKSGQGTLLDLAKFSPSLSITESAPGQNKFDMRGLSTGGYAESDTSDRSLVAVYLDDTPISVQGQTPDLRIYDLDRVEILRGPQGTLYGAGSMAGTIRFITAKPSATSVFGTLEVTGADTEHGNLSDSFRGMVNVPLIADKLALRATVYQGEDGGFIDNIGGRNKQDANLNRSTQARIALRWTPTEKLTADFSYTYEKSRAYGLNSVFTGLAPYTISTNGPEGTRDDFSLYALNWDYDLGFADLVSASSYTWRRLGYQASIEPTIGYFFADYFGLTPSTTSYPLFEPPTTYSQAIADALPPEYFLITQKIQDYMQEVRLVSKDTGPVKWTVGAFYEHQKRNLYQDIPTPGFDTLSYENTYAEFGFIPPFNTPDGLYNSQTVDGAFHPNDIFSGLQNITEHQIALFTDDTWHVTKKFDLTAGVRYFNFHENYYLFEGGVYGVVNHVPLQQYAQQSANGFNPRFNASYHVSDDILVYAEAAKGFRYGGANQPVPIGSSGIALSCAQDLMAYGYSSAPLTFGPDHLWSYSVGEKARVLGGRMTVNTDAYWIDWSDVQTRLALNCSYFFTDNKGSITSRGVEFQTTVRLTPEFTFSGSASYNDARAAENIDTAGAFKGDLAPYFPRWIASANLFYDRSLWAGQLHAQVGYQFRGHEQTAFNPQSTALQGGVLTATGPNPVFAVIPTQNNLSAAAAYDFGRYELGIFGNNLADGVKITDIGRATYYAVYQAGDRDTVARPRTVGLRLKVKF
jgi:outer membrane receptor protein involved in Fe transport